MALTFNGSSSKIVGPTSSTFDFINTTFCIGARWSYQGGTGGQALIAKGGTGSGPGWCILLNGFADGKVRAMYKNSSGALAADAYTSTSSLKNTGWHSAVFQITSSVGIAANNTASIFIDGAYDTILGSTNGTLTSVASTDAVSIGVRGSPSGETTFLDGSCCDIGIWSVALTDAEKAAYCKGQQAKAIRPQSLVFCPPMVRDVIDLKGMSLTATSVTVSAHPRVIGA